MVKIFKVGVVIKKLIVKGMGVFCKSKCFIKGILLKVFRGSRKLRVFFIKLLSKWLWGKLVIYFCLLV